MLSVQAIVMEIWCVEALLFCSLIHDCRNNRLGHLQQLTDWTKLSFPCTIPVIDRRLRSYKTDL